MRSLICILFCIAFSNSASAVTSSRLADTIKSSNGVGNINLYKLSGNRADLTSADLEAFRQDNNGKLVFAIDVNENSSGSENSHSLGIAIQSVSISAVISGQTFTFSNFSTETQASLVAQNGNSKAMYYTSIGDAGSSRITSSGDLNNSSFDSTITVPVNISLSSATSVTMQVRLLQTNQTLGDPEEFYDFSGGYEDLAIITAEDATYLNQLAAGRTQAPMVTLTNPPPPNDMVVTSWQYYPSMTSFYMVAYEDQFPAKGDYDFNDAVIAYRVQFGKNAAGNYISVFAEGYLVSRGGDYDHDFHLRVGLPSGTSGSVTTTLFAPSSNTPESSDTQSFNGAIDVVAFNDIRRLWTDPGYAFVNTLLEQSLKRGYRFTLHAQFDTPTSTTGFQAAPFDPYLFVKTTNYEIHLDGNPARLADSTNSGANGNSFHDALGYPFAMLMPETWQPPLENTDLGLAYPEFTTFVTSGKQQQKQWYNSPSLTKIKPNPPENWKW